MYRQGQLENRAVDNAANSAARCIGMGDVIAILL